MNLFTDDGVTFYDGIMLSGGRAATPEEVAQYEAKKTDLLKPKVVTMRQARLALRELGLLNTIDIAITNGTDEDMKIEWEYATEVNRNWPSLVTMTELLGMSSSELDGLFLLASSK